MMHIHMNMLGFFSGAKSEEFFFLFLTKVHLKTLGVHCTLNSTYQPS